MTVRVGWFVAGFVSALVAVAVAWTVDTAAVVIDSCSPEDR